ncbi:uncharacterized protein LOC62_07G009819 [Vanrija pseudolonga]|uniref:F-box domain-containing protein n=1 Tax=Vanrija pseudolonga TaxID=143232 RepID=A0AAF1BUP1_9TREE|nr:hypothetical protein LOC62_07G009819 [Vanrija pseudolonga]
MPDPLSVFDEYVLGQVWACLDVQTRFVASNVSHAWRASQRPGWKRVALGSSLAEDRKEYYIDLERSGEVVYWRRLAITQCVSDERWAACRARESWVTAPSHCVDYLSPSFHDVYHSSIMYVAGGAGPAGFNTFALDTRGLTTTPFDIPPDTLDAQEVRGAGVAFLRGEEIHVTMGSLGGQRNHGTTRQLLRTFDVCFDPRTEATNDAHVVSGGEYATFRYVVGPNRERQFRAFQSTPHVSRKMELELPYDMPYAVSRAPRAN